MFGHILIACVAYGGSLCLFATAVQAADVVEIAKSIPDGGGYEWKGTGVPDEIRFKNERILEKGKHTYCSGFTFAVVMEASAARELLNDKSPDDIRKFQKQWYGATPESAEEQCVLAVRTLGIGKAVAPEDARPGDFLQLWRTNGSGHSVVFLDWVKAGGRQVGVKYRSSQKSTDGVGDRVEYFADGSNAPALVDAKRMYFCRLDERRD